MDKEVVLEEFLELLPKRFVKQDISKIELESNLLTITVLRSAVLRLLQFLRDDASFLFSQLTDMTCVHSPDEEENFTLVYHLLSVVLSKRICIKVPAQKDVRINSVSSLFPNALWYEREVREMFGISFENHSDLRRLLTEDSLEIHPLLKTFPAHGEHRLEYDKERAQCFYVKQKDASQTRFEGVSLVGESV